MKKGTVVKRRYIKVFMILAVLFVSLFSACRKEKNDVQEEIPAVTTKAALMTSETTLEPTATPDTHEGEARSKLTGLWIDEKAAKKRPYAVMFNNISLANPHSGISQAVILYEAIVEGDITRLMGIFEEFDAERIGSVRSARHYFVSFADEYDAIFVHYGQTKYALAKIASLGVDNLSGLEAVGSTVFYRDKAIKAPHNAFASYEGIQKGTKQKGYRTKYRKGIRHYQFYAEDTDLKKAEKAKKIILGYSNQPYLEYKKKDKLYYRYQFGGAHIDATTKEQLSFKNIIIQYVDEWNIDKKGYQTMNIENASGKGYYATNGKVVEITWKKNEAEKTMHYYDAKGKELVLNAGKTYVAIYPNNRTKGVTFSK